MKPKAPSIIAPTKAANINIDSYPGVLIQIDNESKLPMAPPPEILLQMAEEEIDQRDGEEYLQVISKLREKSFSFREIAKWLEERGILINHNAVYRIYMKNLSRHEIADEIAQQEEEARDEYDREHNS